MEITVVVVVLIFLFLSYNILKQIRRETKHGGPKLPPGSLGWPYIGETVQMYSQHPNVFFATKQKRYGEIFKTHILGCPCVMLASPEAAKFVLVSHAHLFKPTYPKSKEKMIGPSALFFHGGDYHAHLRKLVQTSLSPEKIKKLIPYIENIALSLLDSWAGHGQVINTFIEMKKFSFDVGILSLFGHLDGSIREKLKHNYVIVDKGYNSLPTKIPGTTYHKAVLARKRLSQIVSEIISERKEKRLVDSDLLGHLLNFRDGDGQILTEDQIADNIIGVLFAAQDTTASALTWILKYLQDNHNLLQALKAEHISSGGGRGGGGDQKPLTWAQTKNMPLTYRFMMESLRMATIISFTYREAVVDVEYKGYLIPKGWKVMPLFRNIHHNPDFFPDPQIFDPSRFEVAPRSNTFMPFGNGVHACPGNHLAKLEILVFLHHLLTKFRWEVVGSQSGIEYAPFPIPKQGLPARFWKESISSSP